MFGLHDNATITKDLKDTNQMLSSLLLTQSRSGSGDGGSGKSIEDTLFDTVRARPCPLHPTSYRYRLSGPPDAQR